MLHTSNDIRNPGLRTLPPGVERYFVRGAGLSIVEVSPEDKIEIINDEGRQISEIIVFNSKGKSDLSILNLKENSNGDFSKRTISNDKKISKLLKKKNLDLNNAKASIIFNNDCVMGEKIMLTSRDNCIVVIAAPGDVMNVHEQNPPTDFTIFVNKAKFLETDEQFILPDPLS
jgi:aminomethyltransferase